ncbi:MAG: alpha/beta fold hydrolase [Paracoccaceae bacterium]
MLYELAFPALVAGGCLRWLRGNHGPAPAFGFRATRCGLRRREIALLAAASPALAARVALNRFERTRPVRSDKARSDRLGRGSIALSHVGPAGGPKLLLLHGWNADSAMMMPLAQALAEAGFKVALPDISAGIVSFEARAALLARHCEQSGPWAAVIGHSAGGLIAAMAMSRGLTAERLVTISAPASMARLLQAYLRRTQAPSVLMHAILAAYRACRRTDPTRIGPNDYGRLAHRHLVLHARNDWQVALPEAFEICAATPGKQPVVFDGCNHHNILHHPAVLCTIVEFVRGFDAEKDAM